MTISEEERHLLRDLAKVGFSVESVADLYNQKFDYRIAVPLLIDWLPRIKDSGTKEEIVRALSVKWAKPAAAPVLLEEFDAALDPKGIGIRWALANALSVVSTDSQFERIKDIVRSKKYGKAREMLAVALGNMRNTPESEQILIELLEDEDVAGHALIGLRKLGKGRTAFGRIQKLAQHPKKWIRIEAEKLLVKLGK